MFFEEINEVTLAYIAGFFDGEGCIGTYMDSGTVFTYIFITQNDIEPLLMIQSLFGGKISKAKSDNTSCLMFGKTNGIYFLKQIEKYLIVKKQQAQLCIGLHQHIDKQQLNRWNKTTPEIIQYRKAIVNQIKELKHRK